MKFSTVLFDLDHTLLDTDASEALAFDEMMQSIGVDEPAQHLETYQEINQALWREVEKGTYTANEVSSIRFTQLLETLDLVADPAEMTNTYRRGLSNLGELYPGALDLLESLNGRRLGLVSNGIGQVQRDRMERLKLNRFFDGVAISGEVGVAKPNPAIFEHLGFDDIDPKDTIMIGDSLTSDIPAGANAGFATCWYNPHNKPMDGSSQPTMTVTALELIPQLLAS